MFRKSSRPITTLFGVPLHVHWSAWLAVALVAIVAPGAVGVDDPGLAAVLSIGTLATVMFVASLLVHELAHALAARRRGIEVDRISLWALGGSTQFRQAPRRPSDEFLVSLAGPAASLVLGGATLTIGLALSAIGTTGPADLAIWTGVFNLVIAGFNLLPGLPLDGGRALHAVIWGRTRDHNRATVVTAMVGSVIGAGVVAFGVWSALSGRGGLLTALFGYLMMSNAGQARATAKVVGRLRGVRAGNAAASLPPSVSAELSVDNFLRYWVPVQPHLGDYVMLVDRDQKMTGLVALEAVRRVPDAISHQVSLGQLAIDPTAIAFVGPNTDLADAVAMSDSGIVIVTEPDRLVGLVVPELSSPMKAAS